MSYRLGSSSRKDRIAARFLGQVHAVLSRAALESRTDHGLTQSQVARELGVDRSFISRLLSGAGNPTVRTIGELAGVLGYRPELVLHKVEERQGANHGNFEVKAIRGSTVVRSPSSAAAGGDKPTAFVYTPKAETADALDQL